MSYWSVCPNSIFITVKKDGAKVVTQDRMCIKTSSALLSHQLSMTFIGLFLSKHSPSSLIKSAIAFNK